MISSPLLASAYERQLPEYGEYQNRMAGGSDTTDALEHASVFAP